jgi:hypothetical protein
MRIFIHRGMENKFSFSNYIRIKHCFSIILCFVFCTAYAQKNSVNNVDPLYYFIDTANTPINAHMWNIDSDNIYKHYTIQCPCLKNEGKPTFYYLIIGKDKGISISQKELRALRLTNLSALIVKAKQIENNEYKRDYSIFLIEPKGKKYVMHEVNFENPTIKIISPPDSFVKKDSL